MNLSEKLNTNLKESMKARDEVKVSTLRFLLSAVHNEKIEKREELTNEDVIGVIQKQVKQRKESIEIFERGDRDDLVQKETKELEILQKYLPEQISDSELDILVDKAIKETSSSSVADIGKVMGKLSSELKGKADMSVVSSIVRKKLS